MTSTLDEISAQIEALSVETAAYFEGLNQSGDFVGLLTSYFHLKTKYDALDTARKRIYEIVDNLNKSVIPARFEALGTDKIQVPDIKKSFYPLTKYSASIVEGMKDDAFEWLRSKELGEIITMTVNAGTLANTLREYVTDTGFDPPEDLFKLSSYSTTGMSNYTPKKK